MLDLAVIGSGPAALSAAIYIARAGYKVSVFEKNAIGGALTEISKIENYPGFIGTGKELAETMKNQVLAFGAKIEYGECESIKKENDNFILSIDGENIESKAVLVATGSEPKKLQIEGIEKPISYCSLCDGALFADKKIAVVGGGNSAVQESIYLAKIAKTVTLFSRSEIKAEKHIIKNLEALSNVEVSENTEITSELLNNFDGIFVFIGKKPATNFVPKNVLDDCGFIKTEEYQTEISGLFAAGDVRKGSIKQAISASSDGAAAAIAVIDFLKHK